MMELLDYQKVQAEIALIAKRLAKSDAQKAIVGRILFMIDNLPAIEAEPLRRGRWIECDYKHMEHGMIETEPKAGLCCSECRSGFHKKKMTYKQYCPHCGAKMEWNDT